MGRDICIFTTDSHNIVKAIILQLKELKFFLKKHARKYPSTLFQISLNYMFTLFLKIFA